MRTENHHSSVGHARQTSAHGHSVHGHREQPSPAFDANDTGGFSRILGSLPLVCGLTVLAVILLSAVSTMVTLSAPDPVALIPLLSLLSMGLASLIGGILSARRNPSAPLPTGLFSGSVMALLVTVVGLCMGGKSSVMTWGMRVSILPIHLLGAYIARPRQRAREHTSGRHQRR